jgi:hypothetical protein
MVALRTAKVDLSKRELISFSATPPSKAKALAAKGFVILEAAAEAVRCRIAKIKRLEDGVGPGIKRRFAGKPRVRTLTLT